MFSFSVLAPWLRSLLPPLPLPIRSQLIIRYQHVSQVVRKQKQSWFEFREQERRPPCHALHRRSNQRQYRNCFDQGWSRSLCTFVRRRLSQGLARVECKMLYLNPHRPILGCWQDRKSPCSWTRSLWFRWPIVGGLQSAPGSFRRILTSVEVKHKLWTEEQFSWFSSL